MAEYAANILKTDALYYRLSRASIRDGILKMSAGGYAETEITSTQLTNLTEHFRVAYMADKFCDNYGANIRIFVYAKDKDENVYNYTFFPCDIADGLYIQEFQLKATPYETLVWRIETDVSINVSLWELCPEAEDINVQTIIDGVNQSLPRLLYDYNTWPLTVEMGEATVGLITFRLIDKTDLQGHFIMSFFASEAAILTVRFYTNEIEELFAPLTYDIRKGYNSIGIPHCYLHRSAGFYSVMATAQVSAGIVTIPTRGVLYSIDGGYLAKRELDVAMDVQDLAIRQTSISYGPDEVWLVGIDAGEILVRKRDYNENNPNVAWTAVLSLGQGLAAAIEFDGYWDFRTNSHQYTIETEEDPWYFWVDVNNVLWGRHGTDEETLIRLDDNVSTVHACRGYKSEQYLDQDQGLVIAYLKEGVPYYRQWVWDNFNHYKRWLDPELLLLSEELFDDIRVTRLNDYRLAFELSNSVHNLWMYTDRTYVNNAAPNEYVYPGYFDDYSTCNYMPDGLDDTLRVVEANISDDRLTLSIVYDKFIVVEDAYLSLQNLLGFSGGIVWNPWDEERNTVESVELLPDEISMTTLLTIRLLRQPNIICHVIFNQNYSPYVHILVGGQYETPNTQRIDTEFDSSIYVTINKDNWLRAERVLSGSLVSTGLNYKDVRYPTHRQPSETVVAGSLVSLGLRYSGITFPTTSQRDTANSGSLVTLNLQYQQTGESPI